MPSDCPRFGKWIGGCRFEARFDKAAARPLTRDELTLAFTEQLPRVHEAVSAKTYVRDVCVRCGRTVERAS